MSALFAIIISILGAYFIGSIPTSFILTKALKGVDIRELGSKNVGATNVFRVAGKLPALVTLIIDILKGVFVVTFVADYSFGFIGNLDYLFYRALLGFIAICGHIWPIFLRFEGGKGVATTIGVMLVVSPIVFLLSGGIWLAVFIFTNYVSLASMALGISMPIFACILNQSIWVIIFTAGLALLNIYKHKANINRLLRGEENKTVIFKSISTRS